MSTTAPQASRHRGRVLVLAATTVLTLAAALPAQAAQTEQPAQTHLPDAAGTSARACPPSAVALGYSDALDKRVVDGVTVGGLSDLARDTRSGDFLATVDNNKADPARLYDLGPDPLAPSITHPALVLRRPDGTPYTGLDADDEGLAVLPDGDYLVSSETEPSIRVFGRDGVQRGELPVPARFRVAPAGEATANATLEGLTISPSGRFVVAAMEGTLSGDLPTGGGEGRYRRFLVYERHGPAYAPLKQVAYRVDPGMRVPEVAAYDDGSLLVEEASFSAATGNAVRLYAVTGLDRAADVTGVADLSTALASPSAPATVLPKTLVADLVRCPTLGATARQPQANPLLDNVEGMAVYDVHRRRGQTRARVSLISDDNFGATQITRVITLEARLP